MLTWEEDVEAHALRRRGWSISAIARHLGKDRKTIRAYLAGERTAGVRAPAGPDEFKPFEDYCRARLMEDPHLWATALFDEVRQLGYDRSYPRLTHNLRVRQLRPVCHACRPVGGRPAAVIEHPPAEETQWDWVELPDPPAGWDGYGPRAFLLVGALSHSSKWRGVLAEAMDLPHLIDAQHQVAARLGGLTRVWRFDRMATVVHPGSGKVTPSYAAVAKHYGVQAKPCPPRRGNRKGVVEKANHSAAQRWWRTLPDDITVAAAQARLDEFCAATGDARDRINADGNRCTVADLAARERLLPLPSAAFPAEVSVARQVSAQALVSFRGNRYSVPPELAGGPVTVNHRLGSPVLSFATGRGVVVALHHRVADGSGATIRSEHHVTALNTAALAAFTTARPHRRKQRIPPGPAAQAAANVLRGNATPSGQDEPVIDLAVYAAAAAARRNLT
jgi:transposase